MPEWVTETGIPCFRPHTRRAPDGTVLYTVAAADLAEIAANSARVTVELHGNKPPITEGHRDFSPDADESAQPLVLGYVEHFRVGELPDGTPAILCDRRYMQKYADRMKRHPYSSVDYLPNKKAIVGVAKLTRPPALNLGGVYYPGTRDPVYVYSAGGDQVDDQAKPNPEAGTQDTPELTPEEQQGCEKVYRYFTTKYKWFGAAAQQYDAAAASGPGSPQGNNTNVPSDKDKKDDDEEKPVENKAAAELVQKYEAQRGEIAQLRADLDAGKVDKLLDQLEAERYQFDRAEERADLLKLDDAGRKARADRIRKYHPQAPGATGIEVYRGNATGPVPEITAEQANKIVKYSTAHQCGYDDAKAAVLAGKS